MAERDFVERLSRAGFEDIEVVERTAWGVRDCSLYPLFTPDLIALMHRLIPEAQRDRIGDSIVVKARWSPRPS